MTPCVVGVDSYTRRRRRRVVAVRSTLGPSRGPTELQSEGSSRTALHGTSPILGRNRGCATSPTRWTDGGRLPLRFLGL